MKEYKTERLIGTSQSSKQTIENSLNIAAMADWELVCVSEGWACYVRERKPKPEGNMSDVKLNNAAAREATEETDESV